MYLLWKFSFDHLLAPNVKCLSSMSAQLSRDRDRLFVQFKHVSLIFCFSLLTPFFLSPFSTTDWSLFYLANEQEWKKNVTLREKLYHPNEWLLLAFEKPALLTLLSAQLHKLCCRIFGFTVQSFLPFTHTSATVPLLPDPDVY